MKDNTLNKNRAAMYRFFSRVFEKECGAAKMNQLAALQAVAEDANEDTKAGAAYIKSFFANLPEKAEDELAADFARTFLAAGMAKGKTAFPYESVYTSKERILMQEAWEKMCGLFRSKNISLSGMSAEIKEDHLTAELLYASYLVENADDAEVLEFLQGHLLNWVPDFVEDILEVAAYDLYKGLGKLLLGFLKDEEAYLTEEIEEQEACESISYAMDKAGIDAVIASLKKDYRVYAPKIVAKRSGIKPMVRYQEISSVDEIYNEDNSDFSPKEIYYPISQTMFYFTETEVMESTVKDDKGIVLFAHPCDINAMRRLDNVFLKNGGDDNADLYYARLRNKVKIVLLECKQSGKDCYCVSMNSNKAEEYDAAIRLEEDGAKVQVKNPSWRKLFAAAEACDFEPAFITENERKVTMPEITCSDDVRLAGSLEYWKGFDDKCISCGGCNTVCPTCSCFDTIDIIYNETSRDGERRRVWSSCMLDTFTMTAGGARARATAGANMRFKALHKAYDYQKRFGTEENMCVGCGRCIKRCPKDLDFANTLNEFAAALAEAKKGGN